jgi:outer membrane immunogenic protein
MQKSGVSKFRSGAHMQKTIGIAIATMAVCGSAMAADLPLRAPIIARSPITYNWTGIYLGVNGGYAWGKQDPFDVITNRFDSLSDSLNGWTFGGTAGAQIQVAHVVLGLETDLDWANIKGSATHTPTIFGTPLPFTLNADFKIPYVATARLRAGYALNNWLFYATGGAALLGNDTTVTTAGGAPCGTNVNILLPNNQLNCSGTKHRIGGTGGAGVEWGLSPNLSVKAEYLYIAAASLELSHINEVRMGLNYRFGDY